MESSEKLLKFGLSRPEAHLYIALMEHGELTGYEAAKLTGFSRSNTYTSLAGLVEKGAAYLLEAQVTKYSPVPFPEFSKNYIAALEQYKQELLLELPSRKETSEGFITIRGSRKILDKFYNMLEEAQYRIYLSVPSSILLPSHSTLKKLSARKLKIVILTDCVYELEGATVYHTAVPESQLRIIVDSAKIMTGELCPAQDAASTCLYSQNQNLVNVFKEMLTNEIRLISQSLPSSG